MPHLIRRHGGLAQVVIVGGRQRERVVLSSEGSPGSAVLSPLRFAVGRNRVVAPPRGSYGHVVSLPSVVETVGANEDACVRGIARREWHNRTASLPDGSSSRLTSIVHAVGDAHQLDQRLDAFAPEFLSTNVTGFSGRRCLLRIFTVKTPRIYGVKSIDTLLAAYCGEPNRFSHARWNSPRRSPFTARREARRRAGVEQGSIAATRGVSTREFGVFAVRLSHPARPAPSAVARTDRVPRRVAGP
ncbi:hypothetical protein DFR70_107186 [Nocardia tenerifensis]|uniref:Uncharacterized protein n=1 Tax=Nocardia tenerifensis TaxID=228006 RepID=A0A318K214_9NOCA|nr:hypothetical protein DFR70_107186 [Nocardia tenerifensis]